MSKQSRCHPLGWEGLATKGQQLKADLLTFCSVFDIALCDALTRKIKKGKEQNHLSYSSAVACYQIRVRQQAEFSGSSALNCIVLMYLH